MADTKITGFPAGTTITGPEVFPGVQSSANVKFTLTQVKTWTSNAPTLVTPALGVATGTSLALGGATIGSDALAVTGSITASASITGASLNAQNNQFIRWTSRGILSSPGVGSVQFGSTDNSAPIAQVISIQSVVGGTSNTAGVNGTVTGSRGTGTGAGGSLIFQTAPAGTTGTAQNALVTALTIDANATPGVTASGVMSAAAYSITGSAIPATGPSIYAPNASQIGLGVGGARVFFLTTTGFAASTTTAASVQNVGAAATVPTLVPNRSDTTTGIGAQASGNVSLIAGGAEITRITSTGLQVISGKAFQLGVAATTGLTAGVLAATTNASIVLTDSAGQAYRIPCII